MKLDHAPGTFVLKPECDCETGNVAGRRQKNGSANAAGFAALIVKFVVSVRLAVGICDCHAERRQCSVRQNELCELRGICRIKSNGWSLMCKPDENESDGAKTSHQPRFKSGNRVPHNFPPPCGVIH
jgi:hypothetical protein